MNAKIVGVCTLQESKFNADHVDLGAVSEAHGVPWFYAEDINSAKALSWIRRTAVVSGVPKNIEPAMDIYASELGTLPFPRSHEAIQVLATLCGAAAGFKAAEAFELLRERS
jgi:hypothetical protein